MNTSFGTLANALAQAAGGLAPVLLALALLAGLALLAYHHGAVAALLKQCLGVASGLCGRLSGLAERGAGASTGAMGAVRDVLTLGGRLPLAALVVAVPPLAAFLAVILYNEFKIWGDYFDSLLPQLLVLPLLGETSTGGVRALLAVVLSLLVGAVLEGLLGLIPLPAVHIADERLRHVVRTVLLVAAVACWMALTFAVVDAANVVYDALGEQVAAQRVLEEQATGLLGSPGVADPLAGPGASPVEVEARRQALAAEWRADGRARAMWVILAALTVQMSTAFAWVAVSAAGLSGLLLLALGTLLLWLLAQALHLLSWGLDALVPVLERGLDLLRRLGGQIIHLARWLRLPLPPPDDDTPGGPLAAETPALPVSPVLALPASDGPVVARAPEDGRVWTRQGGACQRRGSRSPGAAPRRRLASGRASLRRVRAAPPPPADRP